VRRRWMISASRGWTSMSTPFWWGQMPLRLTHSATKPLKT